MIYSSPLVTEGKDTMHIAGSKKLLQLSTLYSRKQARTKPVSLVGETTDFKSGGH